MTGLLTSSKFWKVILKFSTVVNRPVIRHSSGKKLLIWYMSCIALWLQMLMQGSCVERNKSSVFSVLILYSALGNKLKNITLGKTAMQKNNLGSNCYIGCKTVWSKVLLCIKEDPMGSFIENFMEVTSITCTQHHSWCHWSCMTPMLLF